MSDRYRVGDWDVDVAAGRLIRRRGFLRRRIHPDARLMAVLGVLLDTPGKLVTSEQMLKNAWPNRMVTQDSVSTAIYELRQLLGDDATAPSYIRTEARRGYRLIATVIPPGSRGRVRRSAAAFALTGILAFAATLWFIYDSATADAWLLHVDALHDTTQDESLSRLSKAIDATLVGALIHRNPGRVVTAAASSAATLTLESRLVACDLGPALVVSLLDIRTRQYLWSKTYSMDDAAADPTLVELVASDVSAALSQAWRQPALP